MSSINKFLRGKVYNRCRRGHILLSAAIHGLQLVLFYNNITTHCKVITNLYANLSQQLHTTKSN